MKYNYNPSSKKALEFDIAVIGMKQKELDVNHIGRYWKELESGVGDGILTHACQRIFPIGEESFVVGRVYLN